MYSYVGDTSGSRALDTSLFTCFMIPLYHSSFALLAMAASFLSPFHFPVTFSPFHTFA
jgi:hypothetical protein